MPICQVCQKVFPDYVVIEGVLRRLTRRKLCLICSPWGAHNTRSAEAILDIKDGKFHCSSCNQDLPADSFSWGRKRYPHCKECRRLKSIESRQQIKQKAVDSKGGCCQICGYSKTTYALHFHHLDPKEKDFNITGHGYQQWNQIETELKKCVLLCTRCHSEAHEGLVDLAIYINRVTTTPPEASAFDTNKNLK